MAEQYTSVTFAPVQGFIEKSRKLRDLFGSSFILSYLARAICEAAKRHECEVISPALIDVVQGTPNQIVIRGDFPEQVARDAFEQAWRAIASGCRTWIEEQLPHQPYAWGRSWKCWENHAWEFFWAQGNDITAAREQLNQQKLGRGWIGVNWQGESSTLSGADAVAWPEMDVASHPKTHPPSMVAPRIQAFYQELSQLPALDTISKRDQAEKPTSNANPDSPDNSEPDLPFASGNEQLSIPELIKRLVTYQDVVTWIDQRNTRRPTQSAPPKIEHPRTFRDVNRFECDRWTAWFQGDGDSIGRYLQRLNKSGGDEAENLRTFSHAMLNWGKNDLIPSVEQARLSQAISPSQEPTDLGRVVYAGGDDFFGVLFSDRTETAALTYLDWFQSFPEVWEKHRETLTIPTKLTVSVGWVWASPQVPQRDIIQHCHAAEQAAKKGGRDRLAIRVLFAGGNWLEWTCPWQWLRPLFAGYRDREGLAGSTGNWTHLYTDVATLESRHAFTENQTTIAAALFRLYFPDVTEAIAPEHWPEHWWNRPAQHPAGPYTGILGNPVAKLLALGLRSPKIPPPENSDGTNPAGGAQQDIEKDAEQDDYPTDQELNNLNKHSEVIQAFNNWVIGLAHIGFHLHQKRPIRTASNSGSSSTPPVATTP